MVILNGCRRILDEGVKLPVLIISFEDVSYGDQFYAAVMHIARAGVVEELPMGLNLVHSDSSFLILSTIKHKMGSKSEEQFKLD